MSSRHHYGIFQHHVGRKPTGGGTVARPCDPDGTAHDQYNYGGLVPARIYKSESAADRYIDRLYAASLSPSKEN